MKTLKTLIGALAIAGAVINLNAQTNTSTTAGTLQGVIPGAPSMPAMNPAGLDFTNVAFKVASGTTISSDGSTLALVQGDWDAKQFAAFDIGLGAGAELSASGPGLHSAAMDGEVIKNFSNFQLVGKAGGGAVLEGTRSGFGEVGVDINYNLSKGFTAGALSTQELFTFVGGGVRFRFHSAGDVEKLFGVWVGAAF